MSAADDVIRDEAIADLLGTPALVAEVLLVHSYESIQPISLKSLMIEGDIDATLLPLGELLAALMLCEHKHVGMVRDALAERLIYLMPDELADAIDANRKDWNERAEFDREA